MIHSNGWTSTRLAVGAPARSAGWIVALAVVASAVAILPTRSFANGGKSRPDTVREYIRFALESFDEGQRLLDQNPKLAQEHFRKAAQGFGSAIAAGASNAWIEFNIGNSHLQAGDIGLAVLHYRRARLMAPRDPMIADNLSLARSRCPTSMPPSRSTRLFETVFFWHFDTSLRGRVVFCLAAHGAFWLSMTLHAFQRKNSFRLAAVVLGALTLAGAASVGVDTWTRRNAPPGVVLSLDVPVHKGPASTYQRVFEQPLQSGTEFTLRERRGSWWRIELPDGQSGWIEADRAALVSAP